MRLVLFFSLFSTLLFLQTTSKAVSDTQALTTFHKNPWKYMAKFAIAPGVGEFTSRFKFTKAIPHKKTLPNKVNMTVFIYLGISL